MISSLFTKKYLLAVVALPFVHMTAVCMETADTVKIDGMINIPQFDLKGIRNQPGHIPVGITTQIPNRESHLWCTAYKPLPLAQLAGCTDGSIVTIEYPAGYDILHRYQPAGYILVLTCKPNGKKSFSDELSRVLLTLQK